MFIFPLLIKEGRGLLFKKRDNKAENISMRSIEILFELHVAAILVPIRLLVVILKYLGYNYCEMSIGPLKNIIFFCKGSRAASKSSQDLSDGGGAGFPDKRAK